MKKQTFELIKIFLDHFDKHKIQGRMFFFNLSLSLSLFSIILGIYTGQAIYDWIYNFNCK
jgi:hypothetical protein